MTKKLLGVFTAIVTALAVVGVAWAGTDAATSSSNTARTSTQAALDGSSQADSSGITAGAALDASTSATVNSSTSATVDDDDDDDQSSTTSTSVDTSTSTSVDETTSTSADDDDEQATTSTTIDDEDDDRIVVPDEITTHIIPGVGSVTIEASAGQLTLVSVSAPGWDVENEKLEEDRIELEFTNELDAEAEFEARINDGRIEVRIEVDSD